MIQTAIPERADNNANTSEDPIQKIEEKCGWILKKEKVMNLFGVSMNRWRRGWYKIVQRSTMVLHLSYPLDYVC